MVGFRRGVGVLVVSLLSARVASGLLLPSNPDPQQGQIKAMLLDGKSNVAWKDERGMIRFWQPRTPDFFAKLHEELTSRHAAVSQENVQFLAREKKHRSKTINIAISLVEGAALPSWADDVINGAWGKHVSLTVYVKTTGLGRDEEVLLNRSTRFEKVAIANFGRNEQAYVRHLARTYKTFPDVQILTKTNHVTPEMVKFMVDVNRNGSYGFISHPWTFQRRYLTVRCDDAWKEHVLYPEFCASGSREPSWGGAALEPVVPGALFINKARIVENGGNIDLKWPLLHSQGRLPLVQESYGEGIFSIHRRVLAKYPRDWYRTWKNVTYQGLDVQGNLDTMHHDDAMMEIFPLVFSKEAAMSEFPAYHVSPSTVDLFDKH